MPMAGGEAQPITDAPRGVEQFAWRPGGKDIAYVTADEPANQKEIEAHNDAFEVGWNDYLATSAAPVYHLWLVSAAGGAARRLTSGAWSLSADSQAAELSWSPDGKRILFTRVPESSFGASDQSRVQVLDVETAAALAAAAAGTSTRTRRSSRPTARASRSAQPRDGDFNNENEILVLPAGRRTPRRTSRAPSTGTSSTRAGCPTAGRCSWAGTTARRSRSGFSRWTGRRGGSPWRTSCRPGATTSMRTSAPTGRSPSPGASRGARPSCTTCPPPRPPRAG